MPDPPEHPRDESDPNWFRPPTPRERWIGASLFISFGLFFLILYWVERGWKFAWGILIFAAISLWVGIKHALSARF